MADLFDYIKWRGDLDFTQSPFNTVDFLIFSQISYLPLDGIVPHPSEKNGISIDLALNTLKEKLQNGNKRPILIFRDDTDFINALVSSNRFRNCQLLGYVNQIDTELECQFSALCIHTGRSCVAVYRGTDYSFVAWKEDLNMGFMEIIPSQTEAVKYLEKMAALVKCPLYIAGHSKGGNLAIYAASFCSKKIQRRIRDIYSYDAPGFYERVIYSKGFSSIREKIHSFIPQSSVVGMLLERGSNYTVVKSSQTGLMQHSLFSWEVTHNDLVNLEKITPGSRFVDKTLREWLSGLDNERREQFIEAMYTILSASEAKSLNELEISWVTSVGKIIKSIGNIDDSTRKLIGKTFIELLRCAGRNIDTLFKPKDDE
ncbi:MAG: DUF2974 domain-containing protein [Treponema sp.]|jgi:hypothetical protein|nr:DUF2974 domain-containing protein [Treponema sp.]